VMVEPVPGCVHRATRRAVGSQGEQQHAAPLRLLANPSRDLVAVEAINSLPTRARSTCGT
jgi:hypothetical protein